MLRSPRPHPHPPSVLSAAGVEGRTFPPVAARRSQTAHLEPGTVPLGEVDFFIYQIGSLLGRLSVFQPQFMAGGLSGGSRNTFLQLTIL